ncbi:MAG: transglutaminase domain-containing protein [Bacteroidota bacterium]
MKKIILILFLITLYAHTYSQGCTKSSITFNRDAFELSDSLQPNSSIDQLTAQIKSLRNTELDQLYIVAGWIVDNMNFDMQKFKTGGPVDDFEAIFRNKAGTCGEYATIFSEFCTRLGIKNYIIEGYVPEIDNSKSVFVETNHAWNVVKVDNCWYHCDLQGFSGQLVQSQGGEYIFRKQPNPNSFLTKDYFFISKHIPADPMWQFTEYPKDIEMLITGIQIVEEEESAKFNYCDSIHAFCQLSAEEKKIKFAKNANKYNPHNHNVIVINYYNVAVEIINAANGEKDKLIEAKQLLLVAKEHVDYTSNGVQELRADIYEALKYIKKYVP